MLSASNIKINRIDLIPENTTPRRREPQALVDTSMLNPKFSVFFFKYNILFLENMETFSDHEIFYTDGSKLFTNVRMCSNKGPKKKKKPYTPLLSSFSF